MRLSGSRGGALAAALVLASGCAAPQRQAAPPGELDRFLGSSAAERIGTEGWIVVRELRRDVGGGAEEEAIVVEGQLEQGPDPERLRVSIWRPEREGWKRIGRTEPVAGDEVRLLELVRCGGPVLLFEAVELEPDRRRHRLFVLDELPRIRPVLGIERDVAADADAGFSVTEDGFAFRAGAAEERWRCAGGAYEVAAPASSVG